MIAAQMAQYGRMDTEEEELENIAARILSNQEEVKRLADQLNQSKMLKFFKENTQLEEKEITYDKFTQEVYH
jgi:trigger factor